MTLKDSEIGRRGFIIVYFVHFMESWSGWKQNNSVDVQILVDSFYFYVSNINPLLSWL